MAGKFMDQQAIINATITIEEVIDKGKKLSIKAHDGQRIYTYNVWKDKSDGTPTSAHAQFINMGLTVGSTVYIGYVIDEYTTQIGGYDKRVQSKKIISFREAVGQGSQVTSQGIKPRNGANFVPQGPPSDAFGRRLAIHGMVNGLLASGVAIANVSESTIKDLLSLEDRIDKVLSGPQAMPNGSPELPVIQQEELDQQLGEDIPF